VLSKERRHKNNTNIMVRCHPCYLQCLLVPLLVFALIATLWEILPLLITVSYQGASERLSDAPSQGTYKAPRRQERLEILILSMPIAPCSSFHPTILENSTTFQLHGSNQCLPFSSLIQVESSMWKWPFVFGGEISTKCAWRFDWLDFSVEHF
jgi:hypothetical protein